jgi:DNA processing protein
MTAPRKLEIDQADYPDPLRSLPQPPGILHVRGRLELLHRPGIAVIGTRAHSAYGRDATVSLVVGLARAGYTIISGLARGIDGIAHTTALEIGGDTIGVLGTGIDVPYPPEHAELFRMIAARGCLVSEFSPGTPPLKWHFPQRRSTRSMKGRRSSLSQARSTTQPAGARTA